MKIGEFLQHLNLLCVVCATVMFLTATLAMDIQAAGEKKATGQAEIKSAPAKTTKKSSPTKKSTTKKKSSAKKEEFKNLPWPKNILSLAGDGAVLVVDHHASGGASKDLYAHNAEKFYVPASILKIVVSGAALEFLGPDYRFKTDFLLTKNKDLWVVGYGDPYLVSEELSTIVEALQKRGLTEVRDLYIDGSYFEKDLILDGNTQTDSPYDAYNLAVGVNFNTVAFQKTKNGQVARVAAHIPLTPLALEKAAKIKKRGTYRLNIFESPHAAEVNAGEVFKAHLEDSGIRVTGKIFVGQTAPAKRKVYYRHESSKNLEEVLKDLLKYSNNFMTNQIFLALGAEAFGAPATLEKSQKVMNMFFAKHALSPVVMGDGSGLSRQTTMTARQMAEVLRVIEPIRQLLTSRDDGQVYCKTGTMSDIRTLAGFIERPGEPNKPISFVIMLNGTNLPFQARDKILDLLVAKFATEGKSSPPPSAGR